jgi:hypothetical protein
MPMRTAPAGYVEVLKSLDKVLDGSPNVQVISSTLATQPRQVYQRNWCRETAAVAVSRLTLHFQGRNMTFDVRIGTILMQDRPLMSRRLGLEPDRYAHNWSVLRAVNGFSLDRKVRAAGWNSIFMAGTITASAFGSINEGSLRAALKRIFSKVRAQDFNCLEVTGIVARHFLGIPYVTVSAHSRHIQQGYLLDSPRARQTSQMAEGAVQA